MLYLFQVKAHRLVLGTQNTAFARLFDEQEKAGKKEGEEEKEKEEVERMKEVKVGVTGEALRVVVEHVYR